MNSSKGSVTFMNTQSPVASRPLQPTDEDLWRAVQVGDESAFEVLYRRHERTALRVARRVCGAAAEDAVQAAFVSIWRSRASFRHSKGSVRGWLLTVVRRRAIDVLRESSRRTERSVDESLLELEDPRRTEILVADLETRRAVRSAVAGLPAAQRQVLELAYFEDYSQSEIARLLDVPLGTIKGRTRLALQKLPCKLDVHRPELALAPA